MRLLTPRLEMVAATLEHVYAELESAGRLSLMLNAVVSPSWPPGEYDRPAQEYFRDKLKETGPDAAGLYNWYLILRGDHQHKPALIGAGGFLGPPDDCGVVETGISILPEFEGHGYATEAIKALIHYAFGDHRVKKIIAHAALNNQISQRVLAKSGFRCIGNGTEPGSLRFEILRMSP